MAENNDDILSLDPETPDSGPSGNTPSGGTPPQGGPASRKIAGKPSTGGESIQRRLYKRLPFILIFLVIMIIVVLFIVKGMISDGIHHAMQSPSHTAKQKPLLYSHQQQSEINSIKRMLQEEQEKKAQPAQTPHSQHAQQPAGPTLGSGLPGTGANTNPDDMQAKEAQIAASPLVALRGTIPSPHTRSTASGYASNSPEAIQKKIQQLQAEKQAAYKSDSDNNLGISGIDKAEKLAMESAGLHGGAMAAQSNSGSDTAWTNKNQGSSGYGSVIQTLPKLHGVALYPGAIIPVVTIVRLNTQIPGQIIAQVTRTVYSATGERAIPAGSRLIGRYDGQVFDGQNRVMMSFTRVIFPGGKEIALHGMNATGRKGTSGVNGNLHTHFWTALGSSLLVALITDGVDSIPNPNNSTTGNTYVGGGNSPTQAGAQVLQQQAQNLLKPYTNIQPTVTIPPGTPFRIMVNKTILLPTD